MITYYCLHDLSRERKVLRTLFTSLAKFKIEMAPYGHTYRNWDQRNPFHFVVITGYNRHNYNKSQP